jgi:sulfite dehydrogenase
MKIYSSHFSRHVISGVTVAATALIVALPFARALEIKLPPETATLAPSANPGYQAAQTYCVTCHSAEYVRTQPQNLTPAYWKATVAKMKKAFGAPIPDEQLDVITDYLVKTYGTGQPVPLVSPPAAPAGKKSRE